MTFTKIRIFDALACLACLLASVALVVGGAFFGFLGMPVDIVAAAMSSGFALALLAAYFYVHIGLG